MIDEDIKSKLKWVSVRVFSTEVIELCDIVEINEYYPRVLISTKSCISTGLDSSSAWRGIRIGFTTIVIDIT